MTTPTPIELRRQRERPRVPPHNVDAEEALLGAMLLSRDAIAEAVTTCAGDDFYKPAHATVFDAIKSMSDRGEPIDLVTVAEELRRADVLDTVGGPALLLALQGATPATSNAGRYARTVREYADLRRLIAAAGEIAELGYALPSDVPTAFSRARDLIAGATAGVPDVADGESLAPVDLEAVLNGSTLQPIPDLLTRDDGRSLFYAGAVNGIHGDSGVGKGWVVAALIVENARRGRRTLYLDLEDTPQSVTARLLMLGMSPDQVLHWLVYVRPQVSLDAVAVGRIAELVQHRNISTVVIDSLGEAFALEGTDENKDVEVGPWFRRVARVLADLGTAVVIVDHSTKASDNPLHPSGSKRKRAAITGASYLVEAVQPFVKGDGGRLRLTCAKDRHGAYRRSEVVADLVMSTGTTSDVSLRLYAPSAGVLSDTTVPTILAARSAIAAAKEAGGTLSQRELVGLMKIKAGTDTKRAGIDYAASKGALVESAGPRNSRMFSYASDLEES